ncbi:Gfo/Idh/MocA family protein [Planctomycetota bacterium]
MSTYKIGFIGCGGMARGQHLPGFTSVENAEVNAVTEPSENSVKLLEEKCSESGIEIPHLYSDYKEMLEHEDLDIVGIFTPHTQHYFQAADSLAKGCHVLVEKPMVTTPAQARSLKKKSEESGKVLSIAYPGAFSLHHSALRKYIESGKAGRITMVLAHVMQGGWKNGTKGKWRQNPDLSGGGQFYDTGSHLINSLIWILNDEVKEVTGFISREETPVDVNGAVSLYFKSGVIASVLIGGHSSTSCVENIVFYGEQATLSTGIWGGRFEAVDKQGNAATQETEQEVSLQQTFIDVVDGKRENPAPVEFGIYLADFMEKLYSNVKVV